MAVDGVVFVDFASRTLTVRLPDQAGGYARRLWRGGLGGSAPAEEAGGPSAPPVVRADVPGGPQVVHARPGEGGTLVFAFPVGVVGFSELIGRPGLKAIVTLDIASRGFVNVRFVNRPAA